MGFSSQAGHLIMKTQAAPGVYEPTTGADGVAIKLRSGSMSANRELLIPDPEIGGGRDTTDAYLGTVVWSGDFDFYCRIEAVATLLKGVLGTAAVPATATGVTTHTLTPSDASQLPFFSVEEKIGNGLECYQYTDVVVNSFHLEADAAGYMTGTFSLIGMKQVAGATATVAPKWDNTPMFVGSNIAVQYNSVGLPAKSFSLDINNNFEDDDFRLGSFFIGDLTPKSREISASFNLRHANSDLWRTAVYGSSAAVEPGGQTVKAPLSIVARTYEDIVGGTPLTKAEIGLTIPKFALTPFSFEASGDDILENDIEGRALRPDPGVKILTAVIKTAKATIA